jgi:hypothetical protein
MGLFFYRQNLLKLLFSEEFEQPTWNGTYNTASLVYPTFTESALILEAFEQPTWNGTYNTASLVYPTFTGSVLLAEEFESGSWPNI